MEKIGHTSVEVLLKLLKGEELEKNVHEIPGADKTGADHKSTSDKYLKNRLTQGESML